MIWNDVYEMAALYLSENESRATVQQLDDELVNEDAVERLAKTVRARPALIVSVGDPTALDYDSTAQASAITIPLEVIVAVSDLSSQRKQIDRAREMVVEVRRLLQAKGFESDDTSRGVFIWENDEHLGTSRNLTLYSVMFRVNVKYEVA